MVARASKLTRTASQRVAHASRCRCRFLAMVRRQLQHLAAATLRGRHQHAGGWHFGQRGAPDDAHLVLARLGESS